ncbi:hypothetical protein BJY00DRAFT_321364 [Aspergillus carlsbadensis]|nr:hypothetical protein BJY00DRAFT_321364 [Aspergillus carlsbadensis]
MSATVTQTITPTTSGPSLRVIKNGFGAEITGLDFANGVTDEGYRYIEEAVKSHGFAVVRKTKLLDETHLELARKFGELDDVTPYNKAGRAHRLKYNELFDVGNIDTDGSIVDLSSPRGEANKGNALFHTDSSFNPRRAGYSLLLAHELPPPGTGGSTAFADMRSAYRDLDPEFKRFLEEKKFIARHSLLHSKKMAAPECFRDIDPADHFMSRHLLLQVHERTGIPMIYLAKHIHSLEGVSAEESQAILDRLFDHATQDKYVINVEWKDVGDMIVWDNTCTMHRAVGGDFSGSIACPRSEEGFEIEDGAARKDSGDLLAMELRNPSDALQILALSGDHQREHRPTATPNDEMDHLRQVTSGDVSPGPSVEGVHTPFGDYELVQRGLLGPDLISELLLRYTRYYHPYCPIVPSYILSPADIGKIQKSDSFLLTSILTIASRDDPRHSLTHRYCWDHAQRLLVDVLLAHPWTQTPRTVEGLLLLAEWLPHIQVQETTSGTPKSLFSEDRTVWSLVGLAVRQGYLQRLDQGAFLNSSSSDSKEQADQHRLVWAYVFMADRQISVRLGQSFWSRGPSLAVKFTAQDFPTLQPHTAGNSEDYASALQASMELVQILHNAHAILYSSKERTRGMVFEGQYARYLDDFRVAALAWHSTWSELPVSASIRNTLLIMYEYVTLYTNAFSFQAVITRASSPRSSTTREPSERHLFNGILSNGIMASPDGRYIFDAIGAAMNLLKLLNELDPREVLCYLPTRYYLYGVYAAVLLHKADSAGAFSSRDQRREVTTIARQFASCLGKAASTEPHICQRYSRMLKQLWSGEHPHAHQSQPSVPRSDDEPALLDGFAPSPFFDVVPGEDGNVTFPSIEGYLLGSFMPGVADFSSPMFDEGLPHQYSLGDELHSWGFGERTSPC